MDKVERASKGFTLLELALAVALSAVLLAAFFSTSRALLQGLLLAADGQRGYVEAADVMRQITDDVEQVASASTIATSDYSFAFQTPTVNIAYRLYTTDSASKDTILERSVNGASQSIGPRRMIANFNPYGSTFVFKNQVPSTQPIPLFVFRQPTNLDTAPTLDIQLILQANQTAPISYLRTLAIGYSRTVWW